jgi:hypothetical protein
LDWLKNAPESGPDTRTTKNTKSQLEAIAPAPSFGASASTPSVMSSGPSSFGNSTMEPTTANVASTDPQKKPSTPSSSFGLAASPFGVPSPFGGGQPDQPAFGMQAAMPVPPTGPTATEKTFNGKSAREMLTSFYQERNPGKLGDIDGVLKKYMVRRKQIFFLQLMYFDRVTRKLYLRI